MAQPSDKRGVSRPGAVRLVLLLIGFLLICYIVRPPPPLLRGSKLNNALSASCPPCSCDCSFESESILAMPFDALNSSFADCGKDDPELSDEMQKDNIALLSEEISLQKNVTRDSLQHTNGLIMDAKRTSSHYQREAEKCNAAMETCEEARERAQAALIEERKLSALWETRARENGWNDE